MRRIPDSEELYEIVGRNVARLRSEAQLSQTVLATRCGRTRGSIANIELGKQRPTLHTLWELAEALEVELRTLLPTRADLRAVPEGDGSAPPKTSKRVEKVAGESIGKVATFIAKGREEVRAHGSRRNRKNRKPGSKEGRH